MRCIRAYVDVDMYAGFDVHTEETISDGRRATNEFLDLMKVSLSFGPTDRSKVMTCQSRNTTHRTIRRIGTTQRSMR